LAARDGPEGNSWGGRVLPFLGRISYGIYVWHFVLLWPVSLLEQQGYPVMPARLLGAAATIAISWASFRFFETPLRQFGARLVGARPAFAPA
jgi:peptidoglycan/LPS O-acetylase OafA/YrhL